MPIVKLFEPEKNCIGGLWEISEDISFFEPFVLNFKECFSELLLIKHAHRRLEFVAARFMLFKLCIELGIDFSPILKHESGKPYFENTNVHFSLSHSHHFVAAILHLHSPVGIDIEMIQSRFEQLAHKFLTHDDIFERNTYTICQAWAIKECVFKVYPEMKLNFKDDIRVFYRQNSWNAKAKNIETNVNLFDFQNFIVCYSCAYQQHITSSNSSN